MTMAPHMGHLTKDLRGYSHLILSPNVPIVVTAPLVHSSHIITAIHHPVLEYAPQLFTGLDITVIAGYLKPHHFFFHSSPISVVFNSITRIVTIVIIIGGVSVTVVSEGSRAENDRCEKQQPHGQGNLG